MTETRSSGGGTTTREMQYDGDDLLRTLTATSRRGQSAPVPALSHHYEWSAGPDLPQILTRKSPGREGDFVYGYGRLLMATQQGAAAFSTDVYGSALQTRATREAAFAAG